MRIQRETSDAPDTCQDAVCDGRYPVSLFFHQEALNFFHHHLDIVLKLGKFLDLSGRTAATTERLPTIIGFLSECVTTRDTEEQNTVGPSVRRSGTSVVYDDDNE